MTKEKRNKVYEKYEGRCAYTGKYLDAEWTVDHMNPIALRNRRNKQFVPLNAIDNLMPACLIVNQYKRDMDLEQFRKQMQRFHKLLQGLPKHPYLLKTQRKKEFLLKIAELFDITPNSPFSGKFFFETYQNE